MSGRILLVSGSAQNTTALSESLRSAGFAVEMASQAQSLGGLSGEQFDVILLDVMMPLRRGLQFCRQLYHCGVRGPILLLHGGNAPADPDLLARIRVLLSRAADPSICGLEEFRFGNVTVDLANGVVTRGSMSAQLSSKQLQLLRYLILWRGSVLSRKELLTAVWQYRATMTRTVDVHVSALRHKLEENPHRPRYIRTVRGEGYNLSLPGET